jgi:hypothetical protein
MMQEFISRSSSYLVKDGHMDQFSDLCDWAGDGQSEFPTIHVEFKNNVNLVVYELACIETTCICYEFDEPMSLCEYCNIVLLMC